MIRKGLYALSLLAGLILVGCGNQTVDSDVLVVAQSADAVSLDPHASNDNRSSLINGQIYETLVRQNEELEIEPSLAESWTMIDDRTIEFNLRKEVYFHNGELFTASDVEFTLLRALESAHVSHIVGEIDPEGIEVINDHTIRISTHEPFAPILAHLAHSAMGILNQVAVEEHGDAYGQNPVGTGPFVFENWLPGESIELVRNEDYHGELAQSAGLLVKVITEESSRLIELETGAVHVALDVSPSDINRIESHGDLTLLRDPNLRTSYISFNLEQEPFNDVRVRQAINYAIDTNLIIDTILEGVGEFATGPIGPNIWGANTDLTGYEHNVARAKELLAEAGFENGFSTTLWIDDDAQRTAIATVVRNQLEDIGIDAEIQSMEWATYLARTGEGQHNMAILGWTSVTADADYGLFPLFHSSQFGAAGNRSFYQNEDLDTLLEAARSTSDADQRLAYYLEAQEIIVNDAPWVFLNNAETLVGTRSNVNGFRLSPSGHHRFVNAYVE